MIDQIGQMDQMDPVAAVVQVAPQNQPSQPEPAQTRLTLRDQLGLSFLWLSLNFHFAALLPIVIPAQILLFITPGAVGNVSQATFLGALAALGAVTALVVQPIAGALSDRTVSRWGRRRPYILAGAVVLLAGLALLAVTRVTALYIVGLFLVVVAHTTSSAAYQGLLPDRVPAQQRGSASGYMGLMTILGTVGSLALAAVLLSQSTAGRAVGAGIAHGASLYYAVSAVVLVIGVVVTLVAVREAPVIRAKGPHVLKGADRSGGARLRERFVRLWIAPWRHENFTWVFLTRCFVMLGLSLFMTFIEYYFAQVQHVTSFVQATAFNAVLALLGAICSTLVLGILSDRTRRVPVVFVSTGFMAVTALAFVLAPGSIPLWPLGIVFGLGYGAYTSVDWALAIDALPSLNEAGKDLGLWSIASTLPAILAPLLGSLIIAVVSPWGGTPLAYRLVFALAALFLVLGAVFVLKVREGRRGVPAAQPEESEAA